MWTLIAMALLIGPPAQAADGRRPSSSKLSLHLIGRYTDGARRVVRAGPPVLKVLDLHDRMLQALRDYKRQWPNGKTVVRIYTQKHYGRDADPIEAARDYWNHALQPAVDRLSAADRKLIDYLEGPNECEAYPAWESAQTAAWFADFWQVLAGLMADAGFRPCIGSIPVGNPPGSAEEIEAKIVAFAPALRQARRLGGAWSYHAYSLSYSTDVGEELYYSLRYRLLHDIIRRRVPDAADLPLIITEAGVDRTGNPQEDGWQARGPIHKFCHWLGWFDEMLRQDDYVLGATLFQSGDFHGWPSFETEPITGWMALHSRLHAYGPSAAE